MNEIERFTQTLGRLSEQEFMHEKPQRLTLRVIEGDKERLLEFSGPRVLIGAHPDADLQLDSGTASAIHCELKVSEAGEIRLRDLGSKNGTHGGHGIRIHDADLELSATFTAGTASITVMRVDDEPVPLSTRAGFGPLLGRGATMAELFARLSRIASVDLDALIHGETGTGKELVARAIHDASSRADGPFIIIDSTTLNSGNVEGELFGHRRGAFTGADQDHAGLFEHAEGGTIFIDEVGDLPLDLQPKLLRALESRTTRRVGESSYRPFNARIISATHWDLPSKVNEGHFREDLYYRLDRVQVTIPALRDRESSNISMLANAFLERFSAYRDDGMKLRFDREALTALKQHPWPGNVRQLKNCVEAVALLCPGPTVHASDLNLRSTATTPDASMFEKPWKEALADFERSYAESKMRASDGNRSEAARRAGLSRNGFSNLLKRTEPK